MPWPGRLGAVLISCCTAQPANGGQPMTEATSRTAAEPLSALLARGEPSRPAFVVPDGGQVLTYARVAAGIEALAQRLAGAGVRRGDRVALTLPNGPDFVLLLLAITALGAAAAPLNPAYTQAECGFFLADIAPRLFLIPASRPAAAADAAAGTLRFARSCSSALSAALLERAEASYRVPMLEAYGMTEASHQMTSNPLPPAARVPGSVGLPTGTEIGVIDADGTLLPDGSAGEVVIRGPGVIDG